MLVQTRCKQHQCDHISCCTAHEHEHHHALSISQPEISSRHSTTCCHSIHHEAFNTTHSHCSAVVSRPTMNVLQTQPQTPRAAQQHTTTVAEATTLQLPCHSRRQLLHCCCCHLLLLVLLSLVRALIVALVTQAPLIAPSLSQLHSLLEAGLVHRVEKLH